MSRAGVAVERNISIVMGRIYKLMFVPFLRPAGSLLWGRYRFLHGFFGKSLIVLTSLYKKNKDFAFI